MSLPPEIVERLTKSMLPERVCLTCGRPSVRMLKSTDGQQPRLAAHIKERRKASGLSLDDIDNWFGYSDGASHWERTDASGARIPSSDDWTLLKDRLGLSDEFDGVIRRYSERRLVKSGVEVEGSARVVGDFQGSGSAGKQDGGITAQWTTLGFSDCGHDAWRPGSVLIFE